MRENTYFDYIITGGGASGLSLAVRMAMDPWFNEKKILIIDCESKNKNDRTWCFWEDGSGYFDKIVYHRWGKLMFYANDSAKELDILPYQYKMIRGIDFYRHCHDLIKGKNNIEIRIEKVLNVSTFENKAQVQTTLSVYQADYVFNSILFEQPAKSNKHHILLQHFKGWFIESAAGKFDPNVAGFMDFRVDQKEGTTFVYVLPFSKNSALVEYTYFTEKILDDKVYEDNLAWYIKEYLGLQEFSVKEKEFGIIPMTDFKFSRQNGRIVNIGTAGGFTKASSGFTFRFIQKNADKMIDSLKKNEFPVSPKTFRQKMFEFYDSTLLNVLQMDRSMGKKVFIDLFKNCRARDVLEFLDNEGRITNDLKIIKSVPKLRFSKAGLEELYKAIFLK